MRPEDALQISVVDYLRRALTAASWFCAIPNGAVFAGGKIDRARQGAKLKAMGLRPGAPDLFVVHAGHFLGIELKAGKGTQEPSQVATQGEIMNAGAPYTIARSIDDVEMILVTAGVPLRAQLARLG